MSLSLHYSLVPLLPIFGPEVSTDGFTINIWWGYSQNLRTDEILAIIQIKAIAGAFIVKWVFGFIVTKLYSSL